MAESANAASAERDAALWAAVVAGHDAYYGARTAFHAEATDKVAVLRRAMQRAGERHIALDWASYLAPEARAALLPELLDACLSHRDAGRARDIIASLPRAGLLVRVEELVEPYLAKGGEEEYQRFLELYRVLDPTLTARLARRALVHPDPHVREAGADFLEPGGDR